MTDPIPAFFDELRRIHQQAGLPGAETIAALIGRRNISAGVVGDALRGPRLASWAKVNLIVKALGADPGYIHSLWRAAHDAQSRPDRDMPAEESRPAQEAQPERPPGPALDRGDLEGWMKHYRPAVDEDPGAAAVMPPTNVERLAQLDPLAANRALAELPANVAARRLAALPDEQAVPIIRVMGLQALDTLINALPSSPERDRLLELRPRRRATAAESEYGTLSEVQKIQNLNPDLARDWGWRSSPRPPSG